MLVGCKDQAPQSVVEFNPHVAAFTSGTISNQSSILVRLSEPACGISPGAVAEGKILATSPQIEGELVWLDERSLVLNPTVALKPGTHYTVALKLGVIIDGAEDFKFDFQTIPLNFRLNLQELQPSSTKSAEKNNLKGTLIISDHIDSRDAKKMLTAEQNGQKLKIEWTEAQGLDKKFDFTILDIERGKKASEVVVTAIGVPIGLDNKVKKEVAVPSINKFITTKCSAKTSPSKYIELIFSDNVKTEQNFDGLITVGDNAKFTTQVENNIVKIFPKSRVGRTTTIVVHPGLMSQKGNKITKKTSYEVAMELARPQAQFLTSGTILPESDGLNVPFRAVCLKQVVVRVVKIFENNIGSFLQDNKLAGRYNLQQAGRLVLKKRIELDPDNLLDLSEWNTFSLDVNDLVKFDRGAIYRIELSFLRENAIYPGMDDPQQDENIATITYSDQITQSEMAYYNAPGTVGSSYYDHYDNDYSGSWSDRNDPSKDAYYTSDRYVSRNLLASNLGVIAKRGNHNEVVAVITDIRTTNPLQGVTVEVYDYQNQLIGSGTTSSTGAAKITTTQTPFLLVAKHNEQRGYLKIDDTNALSLSTFDISGLNAQKGLKGFIYGERGVWRPGDTLNIAFMLEDMNKTLPVGHPLTLEVKNARSQLAYRQNTTINSENIYLFKVPTKSDAPTGNWQAEIKVGGTRFNQTLKVETVKPNRLKIELESNDKIIPASKKQITAQLIATWLHGAKAASLVTEVTAAIIPTTTTFKNYSDYTFDDPTKEITTREFAITESKTNPMGVVSLNKKLSNLDEAPGMVNIALRAKVYEQGGEYSTANFLQKCSPYAAYIGVRTPKGDQRNILLTDQKHKIEVVRVNESGKLTDSKKKLNYIIYKVNWRWWWETTPDNLARYMSSSSNNIVQRGSVAMANGRGAIDFEVKYPEWGRYLVRVFEKDGHSTATTMMIDWPGYAAKPIGDGSDAASMLNIATDKESYSVGQSAKLTFPSTDGGRALVSLENSSKVLKVMWVETQKDFTTFDLPLDHTMSPNVYVNITMLQPHAHSKNNLPIRMYGVVPILVENADTRLLPTINMPKEIRPNQQFEVKVGEKNGKPMSYTLAIVEDGLLGLTNFKTPEPYAHFYAREALGVRTWDVYNDIIGAYGGYIEKSFGIGGDGELDGQRGENNANRFQPVVKVLGPFSLGAGATANHKISMPNYIGSVRTMVVARNENMYGTAQESTPVREPLMVLATMPRVVGPNEEVVLPVTVFAMNNTVKDVAITVKANEMFKVNGQPNSMVSFSKPGDKLVNFKLDVAQKLGIGEITIEATSGSNKATYKLSIDVRNPNPPKTIVNSVMIGSGKSETIGYELFGAEGSNNISLEVSSIEPIDYNKRLKYLRSYPHSCVEQTTSSAFPLLYADTFCELSAQDILDNEAKIRNVINRLQNYITPDGGLSYWSAGTSPNDWGTSYAGHFVLEAEKKGYRPPHGFKEKWIEYQTKTANNWSGNKTHDQHNQAYRLYTLALAGKPNNSAMNRMRNQKGLMKEAAYSLAAAYAIAGNKDVARELIEREFDNSTNNYTYSYGSKIRNQAMVLETLALLGHSEQAAPILKEVSQELSKDQWLSTQEVAYAMVGASRWIAKSGNVKYSYTLNSNKKEGVSSSKVISIVNLPTSKTKGAVMVENTSQTPLFARLITQGAPLEDNSPDVNQNISMDVEYTTMDNKKIDVAKVQQGTEFMATITLKHTAGTRDEYLDIALSQIFPSGWEIRNLRMENSGVTVKGDTPDYQDIKDDRVYTYFDLKPGQTQTFVVLLHASYQGRFYMPAVQCEAMYDNTITARKPGAWVEVIKATE